MKNKCYYPRISHVTDVMPDEEPYFELMYYTNSWRINANFVSMNFDNMNDVKNHLSMFQIIPIAKTL